ncbi:DUF692 domain-containing protein [Denitrobaculum tricleocarpae]|uniref:UPF0276 protein FKG95_27030 n=1 Tax=Denitrobaculum tricleocarpae TaxID=2591009 RepID=A0A545T250_9PROT|nr:DUF692 domain-containing protein [Denitrobaculum tricleocarpae]TQV71291.1 DUF692 domain-containing protein [Denitrobaculum tricleocarpae]
MDTPAKTSSAVPPRAGVGLKAAHYTPILEQHPDIGWFEIHAENYMGAGGPPHRYLEAIRRDYPLSLHGVGLSIGADKPLDQDHLIRLKRLNERYQPGLFSEHLAWSTHDEFFFNDLLPVPYTQEALARCADHIDQVQETLGRQMLLENPSTYVTFEDSSMSEIEFLRSLSERTGCGLLLDVNNVFVSATNHGYSPEDYLDAFPIERVGEIHLGGHARDQDDAGAPLLIDAHDRAVADPVWMLYARVIGRSGNLPTLIEWDNELPSWQELFAEAQAADAILLQDPPEQQHVAR